jgi:hypothetical protein
MRAFPGLSRRLISVTAAAVVVAGTAALGYGTAVADEDTRPIVTSTAYRAPAIETDLAYNVGVPGVFTLNARIADAASFVWRTDDGQSGTVAADSAGDATVSIAPRRAGRQFLTVRTIGRDGTEHAESAYEFLVDNGPAVARDPAGIVYLGATPTFHLTPRTPAVQEYLAWPYTGGGERPEQKVTVPARADGTADLSWYMDDRSMLALLVQSRDAAGELSEIRTAWAGPDGAAPRLSGTGSPDLGAESSFIARTGMPDVVAFDVTLNDDPATKRSVRPAVDGAGPFRVAATRTGANWVKVTARNARGLTTDETEEVWWVTDFPRVTSPDFALGQTGPAGRKAPGTFRFTSRLPGSTAFEWRTGTEWNTLPAAADGTATLTWTPDRTGTHTISVRSVTADGKRSTISASSFAVAVVNGRLTSVSPGSVTTGEKRLFSLTGSFLHPRDVIELIPAAGTPVPVVIKSVDGTGEYATAEVDFTGVPAGPASLTLKPYGGTLHDTLADVIMVKPLPALKVIKAPAVSGTVKVASTVKATAGTWSPAATSVKYQWKANGATITGATGSSYLIAPAQAGKRLSVTVTASRTGNSATSTTSASTVTVAKGTASKATAKPRITGTPKVGRTLQASTGTWSPKATSYAYEWRASGKVIKGATGKSLKLTSSMNKKKITVTVVARRTGYLDGRATSASVTARR